ncbi:MAG: Do family serine endopeptidase [Rhizobiaceae bacterium]
MTNKTSKKTKLLGGVAAVGLASAFLVGGVVNPITPVLAEAVRVEAPQAPSFADVVEAVSPAVVSVRVKAKVQPASDNSFPNFRGFGFDNLPQDHPFRRFFEGPRGNKEFGQRRDRRGNERKRGPRRFGGAQGSGFFVSDDGYLVTNNHVVKGGSEFTIITSNGDEHDARLIGADPKTDLAVLKVDTDAKFTYVDFAEKASRVGEWVVAVGNPFGLGGTVTAGIVSASGRDIGSGPYDDFIQIDAAVNKGNSGGPAFNLNGEVIGVNTAIFSPSGGNVGIAFAISAKTSEEVVRDLIESGSVTRGWLGVQIQPVTKDIAESVGLTEAEGTIVAETQTDSPAAKGGIESGDIILQVNGKGIKGPKALAKEIAGFEPEEVVKITVFRDGERQDIDVTLGKLPQPDRVAAAPAAENPAATPTGVELDELGLSITKSGSDVVVADVARDSAAARKGMKRGDVIVSVNGVDAKSVNDVGLAVTKAMEDERKAILFQVQTGERSRFVALPIAQG